MRTFFAGILICLLFVVAQVTTWALDRKGPYDRLFGMVVVEDPIKCGEGVTDMRAKIVPGACVAIEWTIELYTQACYPISSRHVSREIKDGNGIHILAKTDNVYGGNKRAFTNPLRRPFVLPAFSIPGPAEYGSEACFICNPLQWAVNWPVCVNTPNAYYVVEQP